MILGTVTKRRVPVVSIGIAGTVHRAVIDTGFNGDLELPESLHDKLNARWAAQSVAELAGGVCSVEDIYLVDFPFDNQVIADAEASFVEGEDILIGTKLLAHHRLQFDFPKQTVQIDKG